MLRDPLVADEAVCFEARQLRVDLAVASVPEGADAVFELAGDVVAGQGATGQQSQQSVAKHRSHYDYIDI